MGELLFRIACFRWENNFYGMLVLSSRFSGGSSLGFRADSLQVRQHAKRLNIKTLTCKRQNITIKLFQQECTMPNNQKLTQTPHQIPSPVVKRYEYR